MDDIAIESYGGGFILADYSGNRGKFGAAYCGSDGLWRDQPIGMEPFQTKEEAKTKIDNQKK